MNAHSEPQFAGEDLRFAVLHWLVSHLEDAGKIQLQKLAYFLQESYGIPLGYTFRMHHYGPYSRDLDNDLLKLRLMGFVDVQPDDSGYGFHVTSSCDADTAWTNTLASYENMLRDELSKLGGLPAYVLEIQATVHYVSDLIEGASPEDIVKVVHSLKPKFLPDVIERAQKQLEEQGLLEHGRARGTERPHD